MADGTKVVKDQIFAAYPEEISPTFLKNFVCLDEILPNKEPGLSVGLRAVGKNKFNVINTITGAVLNEAPLNAADAKLFLEEGTPLPKLEKATSVRKEKVKAEPDDEDEDEEDEEEEFDK